MKKILLLVFFFGASAFANFENDFVRAPFLFRIERPAPPDPDSVPRPGETQDDVDHRLGPWLNLKDGGIAVGNPQGTNPYGQLVNGTPLPINGTGFRRLDPTWGTGHMISLIEESAAEINRIYPNVTVYIGDIAKQLGGYFNPPHLSHQNGLDADVLFMGAKSYDSVLDKDGNVTDRFDKEKNWQYWRLITAQRFAQNGKVDSIVSMILIAPQIKVALCDWAKTTNHLVDPLDILVMRALRPTVGHEDHFHIRLRCSPYHKDCTGTYAPPAQTGC